MNKIKDKIDEIWKKHFKNYNSVTFDRKLEMNKSFELKIWKEAQKDLLEELYNSLTHDDDEEKTLYLPLIKLGELKERLK